ncbi:MAG TPA: hemerythrin domain-containing protein [Sphingomicrobium sp.]|nr:hemerythrin domain-containing protein [Sphingomicrobium sp.]
MATRTQSRSSNRSSSNRSNTSESRSGSRSGSTSAFSWGDSAGPIIAAAIGGAAIGMAANYGRKALMQGMEAAVGDWDEILTAEHQMALGIFDKMLSTDQSQSFKRKMLLMKLTHALDKHAHQEEMVVYPALRQNDQAGDADHLEGEHGYIKTFIYELNQMGVDAPNWLEKVREFRGLVAEHAKMEEEQVFPSFKRGMSQDQNAEITSLVNRDGFWMS